MEILTALLVVAAVGLIAGILLAVASHFFAVAENETAKKVRECLPGANCGACGYAGCDAYAEAVAEGKAEANLCIPGGADVASQLSDILGVSVSASAPKVAFVNCTGDCNAVNSTVIYDGMQNCGAAKMIYGGPSSCKFGCIGCGDCADVCPVNAICVHDGLAHVDPRVCIGCGKCVKTCPKSVISLVPQTIAAAVACSNTEKGAVARKNCKNACIGCKKCEKICPEGAIKVIDNLAVIDYEKCADCGICTAQCPTGCLKLVDMVNGKVGY